VSVGPKRPSGFHGAICANFKEALAICGRKSIVGSLSGRCHRTRFEPITGRYFHLDLFGGSTDLSR